MDQAQAIADLLRMLRRRFLIVALAATVGIVASVIYAKGRPSVYETSAKILIESQLIPDDLARSTVNLSAAERLQLIEQRLLARDNLIAVIERLGLFADSPTMTVKTKVELIRAAIRIESISVSGQGPGRGDNVGIFAFTITVRLGDAGQAATVVNEFVESALDQNLRVRADRARDTLAYFEQEEQRVAGAIAAMEAEFSAFKHENAAALPESLSFRRDELTRLHASDLDISRRVLDLEEERGTLAAALAGDRPLGADGTTSRSPEETELRQLELELAQQRQVLGANHPEIRRLEGRIAAVDALVSPLSPDAAAITGGAGEERRTAIQRQIDQLSGQIALLQDQKGDLAERREALEASVRLTPEVEIALNALTRRFGALQTQHSEIAGRRAEARTGEQLEANRQSERFQVVESALVPDEPIGPNRKKIAVMGSGASVGAALGLAFLLEMLNPAIRTSAQMERQLNLRPVVAIPYVATVRERRRRRLAWITGPVLFAIGLALALPLVDRHVMPLKSIGEKIGLGRFLGPTETGP